MTMKRVAVIPSNQAPAKITGKWLKETLKTLGHSITTPKHIPRRLGDVPCLYAYVIVEGQSYKLESEQTYLELKKACLSGHDIVLSRIESNPGQAGSNNGIEYYLSAGS